MFRGRMSDTTGGIVINRKKVDVLSDFIAILLVRLKD